MYTQAEARPGRVLQEMAVGGRKGTASLGQPLGQRPLLPPRAGPAFGQVGWAALPVGNGCITES
jgi:hypothetical protein